MMRSTEILVSLQRIPVLGSLLTAAVLSNRKFIQDRSASIAYFTFFSIFPLILGIIALASFFINPEKVGTDLNSLLAEVVPASADLVSSNIENLVKLRGAMSLISIVTLFWSGKKMFSALSRGINVALGFKPAFYGFLNVFRNFFLAILAMLLMLVPLAVTPLAHIFESLGIAVFGDNARHFLSLATTTAINFSSSFLVLTVLYWIIPYRWLSWKIVIPAAFFTSLFQVAGKSIFMYYLNTTANFKAVYGSLSSIVVLLLWLYFSAYLIIYGAELMSVYLTKSTAAEKV